MLIPFIHLEFLYSILLMLFVSGQQDHQYQWPVAPLVQENSGVVMLFLMKGALMYSVSSHFLIVLPFFVIVLQEDDCQFYIQ